MGPRLPGLLSRDVASMPGRIPALLVSTTGKGLRRSGTSPRRTAARRELSSLPVAVGGAIESRVQNAITRLQPPRVRRVGVHNRSRMIERSWQNGREVFGVALQVSSVNESFLVEVISRDRGAPFHSQTCRPASGQPSQTCYGVANYRSDITPWPRGISKETPEVGRQA